MNQSFEPNGLIVDDTELVRDFAVHILRSAGYAVVSAGSAAEAVCVALAHCRKLDFLLTDYDLGDGNGAEVAAAVRRFFPGVPVVIMSGRDADDLPGVEIADVFLPKPFSIDSLCRALAEALRRPTGKAAAAAA